MHSNVFAHKREHKRESLQFIHVYGRQGDRTKDIIIILYYDAICVATDNYLQNNNAHWPAYRSSITRTRR